MDPTSNTAESAPLRAHLTTLEETQRAFLNILEDMDAERTRLNQAQQALMNILEDVEAERIKAEQARVLLETVNRELEAFSYSVSHDLRAPLRAISGFAQAVTEDYAPRLDKEGQRYLGLIQDSAHRMGQLIDDLLAFSRLGRQQLMETQVDLGALAQGIFQELLAQTSGRSIRLVVRPAPFALGDKTMLGQVLVNLLSNAIKFTRPRAEAVIEFGYLRGVPGGPASPAQNPAFAAPPRTAATGSEVPVLVHPPGVSEAARSTQDAGLRPVPGEGAYYVKDNGVGFDMQYVGKLFGVFQRLHSAAEFEGTGVGLAIVYRIVARHQGRVWAQGQVDRGATFYFALPEG